MAFRSSTVWLLPFTLLCLLVLCIHTADKADPMAWSTIPLGEDEAAADTKIVHPV